MPLRTPNAARLAAYWFGIQVVWGALLGVSLQARASELAPGWALQAYPLLAGCGAAVAAITQIAAGVLSDRLVRAGRGRLPFYLAGALAGAAGVWWFYTAPVFTQAFAAVLLVQFGMNLAIGPYQAALPDYIEEERLGIASSWMAGLQSLGNAAGAVLAGLVNDSRVVAGAIALAVLSSCGLTAAHAATLTRMPLAEERVRITRSYVDLFVSRALIYLGFYTLLGYLFFFVRETLGAALAKPFTGYTLLAVTIAGAAGAVAAAKPADRYDQRAVACTGSAAFAAAIAVLIFMHAASGIIVCGFLAGAAWGVFLTADWALGCRFVPRAHAATALGIWNLALLLPQIAAPFFASAVMRSMHALSGPQTRVAFVLAILEIMAGSIWIWRLPARRRIG